MTHSQENMGDDELLTAGGGVEHLRHLLGYNVSQFCDEAEVSRATYYDWQKRKEATRVMVSSIVKAFPFVSDTWIEEGEGSKFNEKVHDYVSSKPASMLARHLRKEGLPYNPEISFANPYGRLATMQPIPYDKPPQYSTTANDQGLPVSLSIIEFSMREGEVRTLEAGTYFVDMTNLQHLDAAHSQLVMVRMVGDSMASNHGISPGSPMVIRTMRAKTPPTDGLHVLRIEDSVQVRQLQRLPQGRINVVAYNPSYTDFILSVGDDDFEVLGKVETVNQRY